MSKNYIFGPQKIEGQPSSYGESFTAYDAIEIPENLYKSDLTDVIIEFEGIDGIYKFSFADITGDSDDQHVDSVFTMEYLILKHIDDDGCARFYDEDEYKVVVRDFVVDNIVV